MKPVINVVQNKMSFISWLCLTRCSLGNFTAVVYLPFYHNYKSLDSFSLQSHLDIHVYVNIVIVCEVFIVM